MHFNIILLLHMGLVAGDMEPYIVEGEYIDIRKYPHSAMLVVKCNAVYICGGSFISNHVVLTAGHCLNLCVNPANDSITVNYGHSSVYQMRSLKVYKFLLHEEYNDETVENDIGLVYTRTPVHLGNTAKRVAVLSRFPTLATYGFVTGWGLINLHPKELATSLKYVHQYILSPEECRQPLKNLPSGIFCGQSKYINSFPEMGDSGGAFVVYNYVQIGIVSFMETESKIIIYTNTTYYYDWIHKNTLGLLCNFN